MNLKVVGACLIALLTFAVTPAYSQDEGQRASTGGAQTLEDILARQKGLKVDESFRRDNLGNPENAQPISGNLGSLGGVSNSDIYRGIRYSETDVKVSNNGPAAEILVQDGGMDWLLTRQGGIQAYAGYGIGGIILALVIFYFARGRMTIDGGPSGQTIERFKAFERFGHWCLAGSFIMLACTGLLLLFGRSVIIPIFGHEANSAIATFSIWVHNNIAWVFMAALVAIFVMWVAHSERPARGRGAWNGLIHSLDPPCELASFIEFVVELERRVRDFAVLPGLVLHRSGFAFDGDDVTGGTRDRVP